MTPASHGRFSISIDHTGGRASIDVEGDLDIATAPKLARAVESLARETSDIVVGLERVWLMDVPALRRLARAQNRVSVLGARLTLAGASPQVVRMAQLAGLQDVLTSDRLDGLT